METEWRVRQNDCNKLPSLCKKKLVQAGNHQLSASKRGKSNVFKLQQGGWISAKCSDSEDSEARGWVTWGAFGTSSMRSLREVWLQPQAGDGASRDHLDCSCQWLVGVLHQFGEKCKVQDKDRFIAIALWWRAICCSWTNGKAGNVKMWNLQ